MYSHSCASRRPASQKGLQFAKAVVDYIGVEDELLKSRLVEAFSFVPREYFVEQAFGARAHQDISLPIGYGQTISKPSTVARMLAEVAPKKGERVLEVGVGCGYVSALLSALECSVYGIEKVGPLAQAARHRLDGIACRQVLIRYGDGARGWAEMAPFDAIIVSCAFDEIPEELLRQLDDHGRLVAPVTIPLHEGGEGGEQRLYRWRAVSGNGPRDRQYVVEDLGPAHFVAAT